MDDFSIWGFLKIKLKFIDFGAGSNFLIVNSQVDDSSLCEAC
jgi:hypothetical protein